MARPIAVRWTTPDHLAYVFQTRGISRQGALQVLAGNPITDAVDRLHLLPQMADHGTIKFGKGPGAVTITGGMKVSPASVSSVSASTDGGLSLTLSPNDTGGVVIAANPFTGESSWGVSFLWLSLQLGGKGTDGQNNFVKLALGADRPITPQVSIKISLPCFTRAGMTTGSIKQY